MKALKKILLGLVILIIILAVVALFLPSKVHVERSVEVNTPASVVFAEVNNFQNWKNWSPWYERDTAAVYTFEGPETGVGSKQTWSSENKEVGKGSQTIVESVPNSSIKTEIDFMEQGKANGSWAFEETDGVTKVTWAMDADMGMNLIGRFMGLMMDAMVGGDFEKGLGKLKSVVESKAEEDETSQNSAPELTYAVNVAEVESSKALALRISDATPETLGEVLAQSYQKIGAAMGAAGVEMAGPAFCIYHNYSPEVVDMQPAIPVAEGTTAPDGIDLIDTYAGPVALVDYYGDFAGSEQAHIDIDTWVKANDKTIIGAPWEVYVTDPSEEPDTAKWLTKIYYPIQ